MWDNDGGLWERGTIPLDETDDQARKKQTNRDVGTAAGQAAGGKHWEVPAGSTQKNAMSTQARVADNILAHLVGGQPSLFGEIIKDAWRCSVHHGLQVYHDSKDKDPIFWGKSNGRDLVDLGMTLRFGRLPGTV